MRYGFRCIPAASDHLAGKLKEFSILNGMGEVGCDSDHSVIPYDNHIVVLHSRCHSIRKFLRAWEQIRNSRHVPDIKRNLWDHEIVDVVRLPAGQSRGAGRLEMHHNVYIMTCSQNPRMKPDLGCWLGPIENGAVSNAAHTDILCGQVFRPAS